MYAALRPKLRQRMMCEENFASQVSNVSVKPIGRGVQCSRLARRHRTRNPPESRVFHLTQTAKLFEPRPKTSETENDRATK
ncbi:MAG TPA: hypothetical protein DDW52_14495 [Planctomycetaceae bacterium]|nr:hypothetical protein [Planctomycetaceae bacterium]